MITCILLPTSDYLVNIRDRIHQCMHELVVQRFSCLLIYSPPFPLSLSLFLAVRPFLFLSRKEKIEKYLMKPQSMYIGLEMIYACRVKRTSLYLRRNTNNLYNAILCDSWTCFCLQSYFDNLPTNVSKSSPSLFIDSNITKIK